MQAATFQSGLDALRRGDAMLAQQIFEAIIRAGACDASVHLGLAYACTGLCDPTSALAAVDAALALDPHDLRALMLKADLLQAEGNEIAAVAFYRAVIRSVPQGAVLPAELKALVERAESMLKSQEQSFEATLRSHLSEVDTGPLSERFALSMDLLLGKKQIYMQQPRQYYFPGLPQIQFFERADFPWLDRLEAATSDIRREMLAVRAQPSTFSPYVQSDPSRPHLVRGGMLDNPDWSAFFLWRNGQAVADHAQRCPATMAALAGAPLTTMAGRSPSILFSLMRPRSHIPPHHGILNTRLIVHLPLVVPPGCTFRVGNQTRQWVEGQAWVFDDTIEHEAWNPSDYDRVILLFEIWRPELTSSERSQVCAMFSAIDRHNGGVASDWNI